MASGLASRGIPWPIGKKQSDYTGYAVCSVVVWCLIVVVAEILAAGDHVLGSRRFTVAAYYECLGPVAPGSGTAPCWTPPAITVDCDRRIIQFLMHADAVRSRIEASLGGLSPACTIIWPDSATTLDSGEVRIAFAEASNGASSMAVSKACKDRFTELLDAIEAEDVDVLQDTWTRFVERWKRRFPEVDKSVYVQLDGEKCCVNVVGEREKCRATVAELKRLQSALVDEIQRSKSRISEKVPGLTEHKLSLLRMCGFLQTESAESLTATVVDGTVVLEGQPDKVIAWKLKMYQMLASAHSEVVQVDEYVIDILKQEPFRRHLNQLLTPITGVIWYTAGKEVEVYGENQDKVIRQIVFVF